MIYTITLNPAVDVTLYVTSLKEKNSYVTKKHKDPAGKGVNVSKTLLSLGVSSTVVTILAGETGNYIQDELANNHNLIFEMVSGNTRTNIKIIDQSNSAVYELNEAGPTYEIDLVNEVIGRINVSKGDIFVLSGSAPVSIPTSIYRRLIEKLRKLGAYVVMDASGQLLIEGVKGCPSLIKPNKKELEQLMDKEYSSIEEILEDKKKILSLGSDEVLVSLGELGSLYISEYKTYFMDKLNVIVNSTVGAGDSLLSGYIYGLYKGYDAVKCLRIATALASASVETHSTSVPAIKRVKELYKKVDIIPI